MPRKLPNVFGRISCKGAKMKVIYPITLDVKKTTIQKKISAFTGEGGERQLVITLVSGNDKINLTTETVSIVGTKSDGTEFANAAEINDNGQITYILTTQNVAVVGDVDCQVRVLTGSTVLYSAKFVIDVEENLSDEDAETSSNEWTELIAALQEVENLSPKMFKDEGVPSDNPTDYPDIAVGNFYLDETDKKLYYASEVGETVTWERIVTKSELDALYYTATETDTLLSGKADKSTTYTKTEADTLLGGKQNTIDSTHKLSADNVDDTSTTNKFVTASDKSNWNAKADQSTTYTKTEIDTIELSNGRTLSVSMDSSTYVCTFVLKNSAGTTLSTSSIDLPLESVVVGGEYDDTTKKIILTLQNGQTVEFSVADLVSGLVSNSAFAAGLASKQNIIDSSHKLSSDLIDTNGRTNQFIPSGGSNGKLVGYTTHPAWVSMVADMVDDTNTTKKFTNATEKQTWNAKQDALTVTGHGTLNNGTLNITANKSYQAVIRQGQISYDPADYPSVQFGDIATNYNGQTIDVWAQAVAPDENTVYWTNVGSYYSKSEIDTALGNKQDKIQDFRLIKTITITEDVGFLVINKDEDNNSFEVDEVLIIAKDITGTQNGNFIAQARRKNYHYSSTYKRLITMGNKLQTSARTFIVKSEKVRKDLDITVGSYTLNSGERTANQAYTDWSDISDTGVLNEKIDEITILNSGTNVMTAGTIKLYGRTK